jgi:uncharacterized membrane protein YfcA
VSLDAPTLAAIALMAATINGGLGHGFSSITVPLGLLLYTGRVLNPALVLVEVAINGYVLFLNRRSLPAVWLRVMPLVLGIVPGVVAGAWVLSTVDPTWLRLFVFATILPLILLQAAGVRRPVRAERAVGVPLGAGVGVLYAVTTISGPPLALMLNNQGLAKAEFRAALGLIRLVESTLTAVAYAWLGLHTGASATLLLWMAPAVALGVPLGTRLVASLDTETFRRLCMSFDAWLVGFVLARAIVAVAPEAEGLAWALFAAVILADACLLRTYFGRRRWAATVAVASPVVETAGAVEVGR